MEEEDNKMMKEKGSRKEKGKVNFEKTKKEY